MAAVQGSTTAEVVATILGYCVLLGSCTRSVPQIVRIVKNRSADGVSMAAQYAELIAYSITLAYNLRHRYAFSTYGDTATCWLQDIVLIILIARYRKQLGPKTLASGILIGLGLWAMLSGAVSMHALAALQASTIAIIALGGRLPQIMLNARRGNSGELSPLTSILNLAGNVVRLFTTAVLTKDGLNMVATAVQTLLNGILVWQSVRTAMRATQNQTPDAAGAV
ncbi:g6235 [Coccomyxa viridis]|uniref:Mannose-P-dolichol utilization defect 1 protein homolog n=1 Tax=Coccomyxa viridis TaxID=1274662 RepID=A0ABP1FXG7_9CHLO